MEAVLDLLSYLVTFLPPYVLNCDLLICVGKLSYMQGNLENNFSKLLKHNYLKRNWVSGSGAQQNGHL
jgi:hypothetical protein